MFRLSFFKLIKFNFSPIFFFCFIFLHSISNNFLYSKNNIFILIHGAFSTTANGTLENPSGHIYETYKNILKDITFKVFTWSGSPVDSHIQTAAINLSNFIKKECKKTDIITCFAHSHAGNIATKSSQLLLGSEYKIEKLYTLGTPILKTYEPNMKNIGKIYNFFFVLDGVQTLLNGFNRTFDHHERIYNIRITLENKINSDHLNHELFHQKEILPYYIEIEKKIKNNKSIYDGAQIHIVIDMKNKISKIEIDTDQVKIVKNSYTLHLQIKELLIERGINNFIEALRG